MQYFTKAQYVNLLHLLVIIPAIFLAISPKLLGGYKEVHQALVIGVYALLAGSALYHGYLFGKSVYDSMNGVKEVSEPVAEVKPEQEVVSMVDESPVVMSEVVQEVQEVQEAQEAQEPVILNGIEL